MAWVLLSLLLAILIANQRQSGLIKGAWRAMIYSEERRYREMGGDAFQWMLVHYFTVGVPTLLLYGFFFHSCPCSIWHWLLILLIWAVVDGLKWLVRMLIRYTFGLEKMLSNMEQDDDDMWLVSSMILYPVAALVCYMGGSDWMGMALYVVVTVLFGVMLSKMMRSMLVGPMSALYIILYFLTLEVVPLALICRMVKFIS